MDNKLKIKHLLCWMALLGLLLAVGQPGLARTRKGDKLVLDARAAEATRDYLKAYELYEQALKEDPGDTRYQLAYERTRFRAAQEYLKQGQQLRKQAQYAEAAAAIEKAILTDPSLDIARQELEEVRELIRKEEARKASPGQAAAETVKTEEELAEERRKQLLESLQPPPELRPLSRKPINLVINNQTPKVIFETVGKLAGVNVLFDPQFLQQTGNTRRDIQLTNASLEQALDYVSLLTKTFWKPVTENAIFVTQDDPNKRREYADWVVKVFYLRNVNGAQELTEIANNIRQVTNSRFLFPVPTQNALVVRAEKDQVLLIEKLVNDLDKPKPEVIIDVMVFEASRNKTRDLVSSFLSGTTNGLSVPVSFTPRASLGSTTGTSTEANAKPSTIRLNQVSRLSSADFSVSLPNAVFSALMTDNTTRLIQSPQLRALDGLEATLKVGSQVPIAQGAFTSGIGGGTGGLPFANTQFNFQQVGTEVVCTPRVMGQDEVYLKLRITISSVLERIDVGGVQQPVIGNREINHEVRLRAGEVNLIGGLMTQEDTRNLSGTAGLANIPILGRLFSGESVIKRDQEVFIALVPRVVRKFQINEENTRPVAAGTDQVIKLTYTPVETGETPAPAATAPAPPEGTGAAAVPVAPGTPATATTAPALPPATEAPGIPPAPDQASLGSPTRGESLSRGASASPDAASGRSGRSVVTQQGGRTTIAGQEVGMPEIARATPPGTVPSATLRFTPPGLVVQTGSLFTVVLDSQQLQDFHSATFTVEYDPKVLQLKEVRQGSLLAASGKNFGLESRPNHTEGQAQILIKLPEGEAGVSANGSLAVLQFEAVGAGNTNVLAANLSPRNSKGQMIVSQSPVTNIRVQ
jgi:general secretion pathway protein D